MTSISLKLIAELGKNLMPACLKSSLKSCLKMKLKCQEFTGLKGSQKFTMKLIHAGLGHCLTNYCESTTKSQ